LTYPGTILSNSNYQADRERSRCIAPAKLIALFYSVAQYSNFQFITHRDGKLTSIVAASNGQLVNREYFTNQDSIAKLFEIVEDAICASQQRFAIARKAYRLSVTYHPTLGYPTKIDIDYDKQIADEELSLTIENLQALK
jgi:hypothetical protein